jgi:hypothetical protein
VNLSTRLGLKRHTTADRFHIQDYADNWDTLDAAPGLHICTSTSRPTTWGAGQTGRRIGETDTGLVWRWTGTGWTRQSGSGLLLRSARTTDFATSSTSLVVVQSAAVTIPDGNRPVLITVSGPGVYNTVGLTALALFRGATQLQAWQSQGRLAATYDAQPRPLMMSVIDPAPTLGAQSYSLQASAVVGFGGTSTIQASTNAPLALSVVEL